ncbi:MAG: AMP-binding protein, partial [Pyrinomonadaceae bacterium]
MIEFPERFNMSDYFLYHNVEEGREGKVCLYHGDEQFTYGDAVRMSNRAGNAVRALGARVEDRVLIVLPDCPEFAWVWFGASRAGAVITMVNPLLPAIDYEYYLEYTRAPVAVIHESLVEQFAEAARGAKYLRQVLVVGRERGRFESFDEVTRAMSDELTPADTRRDDIAIWLFTSGSTGHPKGAVHFHHDLPYNTECYAKRVLGVNENDLTLAVPKLFFGYAT